MSLSRLFLFLTILCLPIQLGKHWWPSWSYVNGGRVDYLSVVLVVSEIFLVLALVFGWKEINKLKFNKRWLGLGLIALVNIVMAQRMGVAWWSWLRLGLGLGLTFLVWKNQKQVESWLKWIIPAWLVTEWVLGVYQVAVGASWGGLWWWLGERSFSYLSLGVASWTVLGEVWLRAYGTFSHPNSMAGFVLVALWLTQRLKVSSRWWKVGVFSLGILLLGISGSRLAWLALAVWAVTKFKILNFKIKTNWLVWLVVVVGVLLTWGKLGGWEEASWNKRIIQSLEAVKISGENWLLGVGLSNGVVALPYQPVHNVWLLLILELGVVVGLGAALGWWRLRKELGWAVWLGLTVLMLGDHYLVSLVQNRLSLFLLFGLIWGKKKNEH